ncbi:universal stress protein [Halobellus salinisoli]|uniref:universal stress protein n=1 Tax=Halobellus salinisoli TaxID=3108500 RepID=UPI0030080952
MYETILVPVDGSAPSDAAAEHAIALARDAGATLSVLSAVDTHALEAAKLDAAELLEGYEAEAEKYVDAVAERARDVGVDVDVETAVVRGAPYRVILDRIDEIGADLVVMGSQGRRGLERYLLGSTTERVFRLSAVPVLVLRSDEGDYRDPDDADRFGSTDA